MLLEEYVRKPLLRLGRALIREASEWMLVTDALSLVERCDEVRKCSSGTSWCTIIGGTWSEDRCLSILGAAMRDVVALSPPEPVLVSTSEDFKELIEWSPTLASETESSSLFDGLYIISDYAWQVVKERARDVLGDADALFVLALASLIQLLRE